MVKAMRAAKAIEKRVASCDGKVRFPNFALAERTAHRQAQKKNRKFSAYSCLACGCFHVGTHLGSDPATIRSDPRYRYTVYARNQAGSEFIVGWANVPDGGRLAEIVRETPGWSLSCVVPRKGRTS